MADTLKDLPPEERIKRFKELEGKKKKEMEEQRQALEKQRKEIEEAEKGIKDAEGELNEKKKVKEKVPIEQVASETGEGLSEEAKIILKSMQKRVGGKNEVRELTERGEEKQKGKGEQQDQGRLGGFSSFGLEETVQQERREMAGQMREGKGGDYITALSQQPAAQLYAQMSTLYQAVETKGYMNQEEQRRVQYIASAMEKKLEDVDAGRYSLTQEAARATSLTQQMSEVVRGMYKTDSGKKTKELDWYKSG